MSAAALAQVLDPMADDRVHGSLVRQGVAIANARRLLADPAPLLAALAEAGVLEVEWNVAGVDAEGCEWTAGLQEDEPPPLAAWMKRDNGHHERRYVSDWTEVHR